MNEKENDTALGFYLAGLPSKAKINFTTTSLIVMVYSIFFCIFHRFLEQFYMYDRNLKRKAF